jgi:hypothetical protein
MIKRQAHTGNYKANQKAADMSLSTEIHQIIQSRGSIIPEAV